MTTQAMHVAKERQLDWLLGEGLGDARAAHRRGARPWLAAAVALFGIGVACAVAWLQHDPRRDEAQEPVAEPAWHECHGAAAIAQIPADAVNLRCFDFDDKALVQLAAMGRLQRLDLSGTDVNDKGYSVALHITDSGVRALAPLRNLRWLSFAGCHDLKGDSFFALEAMPQLEHLDLTYSGVESPAIERLPRLPSLRTLVLSRCMNFHGGSLAAVATMPGIQRLELRACTTLAAQDVLHTAQMKALRHLDLRDCQGRYRGQRASGFDGGKFVDTDGDGLPDSREATPPPPTEDSIGITDDVVAALAALPLDTLLLGGSESLTDAIGTSLAKMTTLRSLDVGNLPKTTGELLKRLPSGLVTLHLEDNSQWDPQQLSSLPALPALRDLGLSGLRVDPDLLAQVLGDRPLRALRLGGSPAIGKGGEQPPTETTARAAATAIARLAALEFLDLRDATFVDSELLAAIARSPRLRTLDLTAPWRKPALDRRAAVRGLADNRSIQDLRLVWNRLDRQALETLRQLPLRSLDLRGCDLDPDDVKAAAAHWPGCLITMPNGQRWRAP